MTSLEILLDGELIGRLSIEHFDDGMGVGYGSFAPGPSYSEVRARITAAAEARHRRVPHERLDLQARATSGELISTGFVQIDDFSDIAIDAEGAVQFNNPDQWERVSASAV